MFSPAIKVLEISELFIAQVRLHSEEPYSELVGTNSLIYVIYLCQNEKYQFRYPSA